MLASDLLKENGKRLIGRNVLTQPYGAWPGGNAKVTRIRPDKRAPEIVFMVIADFWDEGEMGVFGDEDVELL